jgi:hypothetical protein
MSRQVRKLNKKKRKETKERREEERRIKARKSRTEAKKATRQNLKWREKRKPPHEPCKRTVGSSFQIARYW